MSRGAPILDARAITRTLGVRELLNAVDLSVHDGDRIGLVGQNGCGKSTLARYLAGVEQPDSGTLALRGDATVGYLSQEPVFEAGLTALEVVLGGLGAWSEAYARYQQSTQRLEGMSADGAAAVEKLLATQSKAAEEVERLGGWEREHEAGKLLAKLGIKRPGSEVDTMSGGELRRVALARLFVQSPSLAVLDEPTNHLDVATIEWMEGYLRNEFSGALILITHDRYILDRVVTRTAELHAGTLSLYQGGWSEYLTEKANREAHQSRTLSNQRNLYRKELDWLRTQPKARTTKSKARIERAEALGDEIQNTPKARRASKLTVQSTQMGKRVLDLEALTLQIGERTLVEDLTLHLTRGERVGIVGPNGAGKTTLLRALLGQLTPASGRIKKGKNTEFLYVDQRKDGLEEEKSVVENVGGGRPTVEVFGREMAIESWLERFLFFGQDRRAPVKSLSGGERARVALAKTFLAPGNFLLLDEPTNDLDVATLSALEDMLLDSGVNIFVVTHDRYFLDRIATSILAFEGAGQVVKYEGDYGDYEQAKRAEGLAKQRKPQAAPGVAPKKGPENDSRPAKAGLTYGERLELEEVEGKVAELEVRIAELESSLADPALYTERRDEVPALQEELQAKTAELGSKMGRWEFLEQKKEDALMDR